MDELYLVTVSDAFSPDEVNDSENVNSLEFTFYDIDETCEFVGIMLSQTKTVHIESFI